MKKLLSMVLALVLMCTMLTVVTYAEDAEPDTEPEVTYTERDYEPRDILVTGYKNRTGSATGKAVARVSWKMPEAPVEKTSAYYKNGEDWEELVVTTESIDRFWTVGYATKEIGATSASNQPSGNATFKLVFEYAEHENVEVIYTGTYAVRKTINIGGNMDAAHYSDIDATSETYVEFTDELKKNDVTLKLLSNLYNGSNSRRMELVLKNVLQSGKKYSGSYMVKSGGAQNLGIGKSNSGYKYIWAESWQSVAIDEFTAGNNNLYINLKGTCKATYIDKIQLVSSDGAHSVNIDFDDNGLVFDPLSIKKDNVVASKLSDGTWTVTSVMRNWGYTEKANVTLIAAIYDGEALETVVSNVAQPTHYFTNPSSTGFYKNPSVSFTLKDTATKDYTVKIFRWSDFTDLTPWVDAVTLTE